MNLLEMQPGDVLKDTSLAQLSLVPLQPPGLTPKADQDIFAFLAGPVSPQAPSRAAARLTMTSMSVSSNVITLPRHKFHNLETGPGYHQL